MDGNIIPVNSVGNFNNSVAFTFRGRINDKTYILLKDNEGQIYSNKVGDIQPDSLGIEAENGDEIVFDNSSKIMYINDVEYPYNIVDVFSPAGEILYLEEVYALIQQ